MLKKLKNTISVILLILLSLSHLYAEDKKPGGAPPAIVVVSEIGTGMISPENDFIGTVYYQEVSDAASEVSGKVEEVSFEEGQRLERGTAMVRLSSDLLNKTLQAAQANYDQVLTELEKEELNLKRAVDLFINQLIPERSYDDQRYTVHGLKMKSASMKAEVERLEAELRKKTIEAPFTGIVVKKHVDRGEWISEGATVATLAKDAMVDIIANVPESVIPYMKKGMQVNVAAGSKHIRGTVAAVIPRGDISTRTFPVKIRARNTAGLIEGMEAKVTLPVDIEKKALTVHRDAVISVFGTNAVFVVDDSKARMVPVHVIGYKGMTAGVQAGGLKEGMQAVIKGNERLRDGQAVQISEK